jgi:hypothetical protein
MIELLERHRDKLGDVDLEEYFKNKNHINICKGNDVALFTYNWPGLYTGHYFFESRGKAARERGLEILSEVFTRHPVLTIRGLTPVENRAARWMSRQLGFESLGFVETPKGECEIFLLTKEDYMRNK